MANFSWNPFRWLKNSEPEQTAPIFQCPGDIRPLIWSYTSSTDHKSLKQVCKLFQFEINKIVGVDAILMGPEDVIPGTEQNSSYLVCIPFLRPSTEFEKNVNWIRSVLPRSLTFRRMYNIPANFDTNNLVSNPFLLESIFLDLNESKRQLALSRAQKLLSEYHEVRHLNVTFHSVDLPRHEYYAFVGDSVVLVHHTFNCLEFKHNLTQLTVSIKTNFHGDNFGPLGYYEKRIIGIVPDISLAQQDWLQNPVRLTKLKLDVPMVSVNILTRWKKFIEAQDLLKHLSVNLGFVHWSFFTGVLQRTVRNLEDLDLVLTNYNDRAVLPVAVEIPTIQWFNWDMISPLTQLKSLRICTTCFHSLFLYRVLVTCSGWPHDTHNLEQLSVLPSLEKLVLFGIRLSEEQIRFIFTELLSLRHVKLFCWTKPADVTQIPLVTIDPYLDALNLPVTEELKNRNQSLCQLLNELMLRNQFRHIQLTDLSILVCCLQLRQSVLNRPENSVYSVSWPRPNLPWTERPHDYFRYPLIIKYN